MKPLKVPLEVRIEPVQILALAAGHSSKGLSAHCQAMMDDRVIVGRLVTLTDPKDCGAFAAEIAAVADVGLDAVASQLLELTAGVDAELRGVAGDVESGHETYVEQDGGFVFLKATMNGVAPVKLTNFIARIQAEEVEEDGVESTITFVMEAQIGADRRVFNLPAAQFSALNWVIEKLGAGAVIHAVPSGRDHTRAAIQTLSGDVIRRQIRIHTGWIQNEGEWHYLHHEGAIGAAGSTDVIRVRLAPPLDGFVLPDPPQGGELVAAIRASLRILDLAPDRITVPLLTAVYRAILGPMDATGHIVGPSGVFKTQLAALAQQHFGAVMDAPNLPGSWSSTDNALEGLAFLVKDALLVIDDYVSGTTVQDAARLQRTAGRVIRAQGNRSGRQRMRADGTLRPVRPPRGLILSTGEDIPNGHSLRARQFIIEVADGDVDRVRLTACQEDAAAGLYAAALAGFIRWLAPQYGAINDGLRKHVAALRDQLLTGAVHRRTPGIVADLIYGGELLLQFAEEVGALNAQEHTLLSRRIRTALCDMAAAQTAHQRSSDPAVRFVELLRAAMASGKAHLTNLRGDAPQKETHVWGWRRVPSRGPDGEYSTLQPQGDRVGWVDGDDVYLQPEASYGLVQRMAQLQQETLGVSSSKVLHKRLAEGGYLLSTGGSRNTLTSRKQINSKRIEVLHLAADVLIGDGAAEDADSAAA